MSVDANRRSQAELYGASLADVIGGISLSLGITQGEVARVLGLSAPMLSHLVAARRVKMSNPLAHARLIQLRQLAADVEAGGMPRSVSMRELERIAELSDSWSTGVSQVGPELLLRQAASPEEWRVVIDKLMPEHPGVARALAGLLGLGPPD